MAHCVAIYTNSFLLGFSFLCLKLILIPSLSLAWIIRLSFNWIAACPKSEGLQNVSFRMATALLYPSAVYGKASIAFLAFSQFSKIRKLSNRRRTCFVDGFRILSPEPRPISVRSVEFRDCKLGQHGFNVSTCT